LGTIPQASVTYRRQDYWIENNTSSPAPEWDLEFIVIWNKEAQHMQFDQNPRWRAALSNAIPEVIFQPCPHPPTQNVAKVIKIPRSFRKRLNDSAFTENTRSITTAPDFTALTNNNLRLKVPDWRLWAYTDGSCLTYIKVNNVLEQESLYLRQKQPSMLTLAELGLAIPYTEQN